MNVLGDWRDLLNDKGRQILQLFTQYNEIDNNTKNLLAKLVILHELGEFGDEVPRIIPQRFTQLAREIAQEFPCEEEFTYYVPRCLKGNNCPQGKLYEAYQGIRRKHARYMKKMGVIPKKE